MAPSLSEDTVLVEGPASPKPLAQEPPFSSLQPVKIENKPLKSVIPPVYPTFKLQDIDEFDRLHPHIPKPTGLVPVAKTTKGNSNNVVKFYHLCDSRGIEPSFDCSGDASAGGFMGRVEFGDEVVETTDLWPNKKAAKEAVAELALARLEAVKESLVGTKRKKGDVGSGIDGETVDRSENWIGILVEYTQKAKIDYPEYQEYVSTGIPQRFGATVTFPGGPEGTFGSNLGPFNSKSNAKAAATKDAVTWLRDQGLIRAKPAATATVNSQNTTSDPSNDRTAVDIEIDPDLSAATRLHRLAASLGLVQPRFDCRPAPWNTDDRPAVPIYDAAVYFDKRDVDRDARLGGPVGRVERIPGQKGAKTACYQHVIHFLEGLQRERAD